MEKNPALILLFGSNGQVGREFSITAQNDQRINLISVPRETVDLMVPGTAAHFIRAKKPVGIVNAAAFTAVDNAEDQPEDAWRLNADAPAEIAEAATEIGARLVHLSTDYVFPGDSSKLLSEDDFVEPVNHYGFTKLAGEVKALGVCSNAVVLRTSWVFSIHGQNFVKTMLRLAQSKTELSIVGDQIGGPTSAKSIARACRDIILSKNTSTGTFHFQGAPHTSWAKFAKEIFKIADIDIKINEIPTSDYPTPAKRPLTTKLDCRAITQAFGITQPDWQNDLKEVVEHLLKNEMI